MWYGTLITKSIRPPSGAAQSRWPYAKWLRLFVFIQKPDQVYLEAVQVISLAVWTLSLNHKKLQRRLGVRCAADIAHVNIGPKYAATVPTDMI